MENDISTTLSVKAKAFEKLKGKQFPASEKKFKFFQPSEHYIKILTEIAKAENLDLYFRPQISFQSADYRFDRLNVQYNMDGVTNVYLGVILRPKSIPSTPISS